MYNNTYAAQPQQPAYPNYAASRPLYQPQLGLKGRPVASIEEARASIIDFDGSIFYFPDLSNKRIFTKQIAMDGTVILNVYELTTAPIERENLYVTREEFENFVNSLRAPAPVMEQSIAMETPVQPRPQLNF